MKERALLFEQRSSSAPVAPGAASSAGQPAGFWSSLTARVRAWFEVPLGYEDESGFHYGSQPTPITTPRFATEATSFRARVLTDRADHVMRHSVVLPVANTPAPATPVAALEKTSEPVPH